MPSTPAPETSSLNAVHDYEPDPREVLDLAKRAEIAVAIKLGCSRRLAATMAGCHHATIARTAERDPAFAKQLNEAESGVDFAALKRIQEASAENKNWRAAAWVLERRHPEEFGRATPHTFTGDMVMSLLAQIFHFTLPAVRKDKLNAFMREFNEAMRDVESHVRRADRWRNQARVGDDPRNKPLRSPYEHPGWFDPDQREKRPGDDSQAYIDWLRDLPQEEYDVLRNEYLAKTGQGKNEEEPHEEPSGAEEESAEAASDALAGAAATAVDATAQTMEPAPEPNAAALEQKAAPAEAKTEAAECAAVVQVSAAEWSGAEKAAKRQEAGKREEIPERQEPTQRQEATVAASAAPPPPCPPRAPFPTYPLAPVPDGNLPTEEAHQACRRHMEWLASILGPKLFDINSLQREPPPPQAVPVPVGGAQFGWQLPSPKPR